MFKGRIVKDMGIFKDPSIILLTQLVHAQHDMPSFESALGSCRKIDGILERAESKGCCHIIREGILPSQSLHEIFLKHMSSHVSVIHLSGTSKHLGADEISLISNILSQYPRLRVVYLDGCGSLPFIKALLLKDVPVVLSGPLTPLDQAEPSIAGTFYSRLSYGDSLKESFDEVRDSYERIGIYAAAYDFENDRLDWNGVMEEDLEELPPGMYLLQDHRNQLNWRMPYSERLVQAELEEINTEPEPTNSRLATISVSVLVGLCLLVAGFFIQNSWKPSSLIQENCQFTQDSLGMKTLFLPFYNRANGKMMRKPYSEYIQLESERMSSYPGVMTRYLPVKKQDDVYKVIDKWVMDCNTDLLLWGEWEELEDSTVQMGITYVMPGFAGDSLVQGWTSLNLTHEQLSSQKAEILIKDLIYETIANGFYEFENFEEAIKLFKQVSFTSNELNEEIAMKMAQAYTKIDLLDTARLYYNHALRLNPDNATAHHGLGGILVRQKEFEQALESYWTASNLSPDFLEATYNLGLVHFRLDQFPEARESMKRVLDLDPRNARAKGILSAIYAKEQNEDLLYYYLEEALKDGLNIENLTTYTEVGSYQAEKRFRNLVEKY